MNIMAKKIETEMEPEELKLRCGTKDWYGIYQISDGSPARDCLFMNLKYTRQCGCPVNRRNYKLVYSAPLMEEEDLNTLYMKFNSARPEDFRGHSLSVSDIVVLNRNGVVKAYFVDSIGFQEITDFYD